MPTLAEISRISMQVYTETKLRQEGRRVKP